MEITGAKAEIRISPALPFVLIVIALIATACDSVMIRI